MRSYVKAWIQRWLGTEKPLTRDFEDLASAAIERLAAAQSAHISDLRVLIDKGHEREAELAGMVKLALEHQFYRPTVTGGKAPENRITGSLPVEHMQDVAVFDETEDAAQIKEQQDNLMALIAEQNERGVNKVKA
jgi:hypothetical protein